MCRELLKTVMLGKMVMMPLLLQVFLFHGGTISVHVESFDLCVCMCVLDKKICVRCCLVNFNTQREAPPTHRMKYEIFEKSLPCN